MGGGGKKSQPGGRDRSARVSGLTAKPDRPCFYLKTTLRLEAARRRPEKKGICRRWVWKGFFSTS